MVEKKLLVGCLGRPHDHPTESIILHQHPTPSIMLNMIINEDDDGESELGFCWYTEGAAGYTELRVQLLVQLCVQL